MGIPAEKAAAIIALGGMYGATAPPVNIAVMTIGGGVDIPYVGFGIPLLLLSVPLAIFSVLVLGLKDCKNMDYEQVKIQLQIRDDEKMSFVMLLPVFVLLALILLPSMLPNIVPSLSMTIVFMISALLCILTGKKFSVWAAIKEGVNSSLPVMGILMGVGMFIEIMTMTGVKGWLVVNCLALPDALIFVAIAVTIPLFGAISSLGAASVFGVPFLLALMSRDTIVVAAALASIASVGELMPPTALAGIFCVQGRGTGAIHRCSEEVPSLCAADHCLEPTVYHFCQPNRVPSPLRTARRCHCDDRNYRILADHGVCRSCNRIFAFLKRKTSKMQMNAALVLLPIVLRALMIK